MKTRAFSTRWFRIKFTYVHVRNVGSPWYELKVRIDPR